MIENIKEEVFKILNQDKSGHGIDHIKKVYNLQCKFAINEKLIKTLLL